jgi:uncharacterized protein
MHLPKAYLQEIKKRVKEKEPSAKVILYGSFARGEAQANSDIDLLILVDKPMLSYQDRIRMTYPLYDFALETDQLISPLVRTIKDWEEKFHYTPLYHNIKQEGIEL